MRDFIRWLSTKNFIPYMGNRLGKIGQMTYDLFLNIWLTTYSELTLNKAS